MRANLLLCYQIGVALILHYHEDRSGSVLSCVRVTLIPYDYIGGYIWFCIIMFAGIFHSVLLYGRIDLVLYYHV